MFYNKINTIYSNLYTNLMGTLLFTYAKKEKKERKKTCSSRCLYSIPKQTVLLGGSGSLVFEIRAVDPGYDCFPLG